MRCDNCPLCPIAEDGVCPECEGKYGIEHADGMLGCKHPRNWAEKRSELIWELKWTLPQRSLRK